MDLLKRVPAHLARLAAEGPLESICARCGDCCHFAVTIRPPREPRRLLIGDLPCRHLEREPDGRTRCAVYAERSPKAPWCGTGLRHQVEAGLFPPTCPYVQDADWYTGSEVVAGDEVGDWLDEIMVRLPGLAWTLNRSAVEAFARRWGVKL